MKHSPHPGNLPGKTFMRGHGLCAACTWLWVGLFLAMAARAAEFPQGMMLHYSFDEATGGSMPDKTGRGHDGRATGCIWQPAGKRGGGLDFATTNGVITVTNRPTLQLKQATFATWFKTTKSEPVARFIFEKGPASGYAMGIAGDANKGKAFATINGKTSIGDSNVTDGVWHHMAATYDGENLRLYVDGSLQKQVVALKGEIGANTNDLCIGMNKSSPLPQEKGRSFDGTLDDVMIFNKGVTGDEVLAVIASVKPKFSKYEVQRRLVELKELLDRGLILQDFYDRKVKECETGQ